MPRDAQPTPRIRRNHASWPSRASSHMHLGDMQFHAFTVHANLLGVNRQISNRDSNSAHFAVPTTPPLLRLEHPGARRVAPEPWAALLEQRLRPAVSRGGGVEGVGVGCLGTGCLGTGCLGTGCLGTGTGCLGIGCLGMGCQGGGRVEVRECGASACIQARRAWLRRAPSRRQPQADAQSSRSAPTLAPTPPPAPPPTLAPPRARLPRAPQAVRHRW